jgi:hypothetical protein
VALEDGLKASEREGTPISAKLEIEDRKLQLSVYTLKGNTPTEVVLDPALGSIRKGGKITDRDDLKEAASQTAAMAKATRASLAATGDAVKANPGSRTISAMPRLDGGHAVADVILPQGGAFKTVAEKSIERMQGVICDNDWGGCTDVLLQAISHRTAWTFGIHNRWFCAK